MFIVNPLRRDRPILLLAREKTPYFAAAPLATERFNDKIGEYDYLRSGRLLFFLLGAREESLMNSFVSVLIAVLVLLVGFLLLIKGADAFVDGSSAVARRLRVPGLVIGLTIVAMGTSLPELAVSVTAALAAH